MRGNVNKMFINLSRRSQSLVERQLRLIDELEASEQDADQLANLFKLDHLATRMRRNDENLLVLAGDQGARRRSDPVPMLDVLRAASGEVEQYGRVQLDAQPGFELAGTAVSDVVHLVAELVENATTFSSPSTLVWVRSHSLGASGEMMIEVEDHGIGMGPAELAAANEKLAAPIGMDVSMSRLMGLFVVGRLAQRHRHRRAAAPVRLRRGDRVRPAAGRPDHHAEGRDRPSRRRRGRRTVEPATRPRRSSRRCSRSGSPAAAGRPPVTNGANGRSTTTAIGVAGRRSCPIEPTAPCRTGSRPATPAGGPRPAAHAPSARSADADRRRAAGAGARPQPAPGQRRAGPRRRPADGAPVDRPAPARVAPRLHAGPVELPARREPGARHRPTPADEHGDSVMS